MLKFSGIILVLYVFYYLINIAIDLLRAGPSSRTSGEEGTIIHLGNAEEEKPVEVAHSGRVISLSKKQKIESGPGQMPVDNIFGIVEIEEDGNFYRIADHLLTVEAIA